MVSRISNKHFDGSFVSKVDPDIYYERCLFDSCGCDRGGDCECLCSA